MSKHMHKFQNKPRTTGISTNFNKDATNPMDNWVAGFNAGTEFGYGSGMVNGWATGMATAGLIVCGVWFVQDLYQQYKEHQKEMQMDKMLMQNAIDQANEKDSRKD